MTFNEYQVVAVSTNKYKAEENLACCGLLVASEAGEAAGKIDKHIRKFHNTELSEEEKHALALEIGDIMWCCANLAQQIGYSLEDIAIANKLKLQDRDARHQIESIEGGDYR